VVAHQAETVHPEAEARRALGQQLKQAPAVFLGEEDVLPAVAAQHHVVQTAGQVETGFARHERRLSRAAQ